MKTSSKSWTAYYSEVFKFSTSEKYKQLVEDYLGEKPTSKDYEKCKIIFDKATSSILKDETVCLESSQIKKADSTSDVSISEASHSKIRYIGGACVAKCKFHFMNITRNSLYKNQIKTSTSFAKVKLLDHICSNDDLVSKYPKSLIDTQRKQNISHGLTLINDNAFEFFLEVTQKKQKYHNNVTLALHGASVLTLCEEELINDPALRNT